MCCSTKEAAWNLIWILSKSSKLHLSLAARVARPREDCCRVWENDTNKDLCHKRQSKFLKWYLSINLGSWKDSTTSWPGYTELSLRPSPHIFYKLWCADGLDPRIERIISWKMRGMSQVWNTLLSHPRHYRIWPRLHTFSVRAWWLAKVVGKSRGRQPSGLGPTFLDNTRRTYLSAWNKYVRGDYSRYDALLNLQTAKGIPCSRYDLYCPKYQSYIQWLYIQKVIRGSEQHILTSLGCN